MKGRDAHAIGPGDRHIAALRERDELLLAGPPFVVGGIGEALRNDESARHAEPGRRVEDAEHRFGRHRHDHAIGHAGQSLQRFETGPAGDFGIIRIDRPDRRRQSRTVCADSSILAPEPPRAETPTKAIDRGRNRASIFSVLAPSCMLACRQSMMRKRGRVKPSIGWSS